MSDVSLLRFLNGSDPAIQSEVLSFVHDLELEESRALGRCSLASQCDSRRSFGSFAADIALEARRSTVIFRPHYKPDLSAFEPFYQQLSLFPNGSW